MGRLPIATLCGLGLALVSIQGLGPARAQGDPGRGIRIETLAQGSTDWSGRPLPAYPSGVPLVTVLKITIPPGTSLARHLHPVINAGVLLQGRLLVTSDSGETKRLSAGDGLIEMVNQVHAGTSLGPEPAVIVVVYAGAQGLPTSVPANAASTGL